MRKFFNIIFYIILAVFIYMMSTLVINDFDRTKMNFLGYTPSFVMSNSMAPTMVTGDFVLTRQTDFDSVEVGDIVVYKHVYEDGSTKAIIHRVIEKTEEYLVCKGDNNEQKDPWLIYPEDIRAKVVLH